MIHETQQVFRTLVHLNSYVGERGQLEVLQTTEPITSGIYLLAATLLDQEVSFSTLGIDTAKESYIQQEFRSYPTTVSDADFIFVGATALDEKITELHQAKIGDLIDPQKSATIIVELESLSTEGIHYQIEGPGINDQKRIELPAQLTELLLIRKDLNREYPLGVDLILIDEQLEIMCIPRTTLIKEVA